MNILRSRRSIFGALVLGVILVSGFLAGRASAAQPRMTAALDALRDARTELRNASADKGGHRDRALAYVNEAIDEVEKGINFDRRH